MRKLGLIGGMSWVSTRIYYEAINRLVARGAGPMASAPLLIESLDFASLHGLTEQGDWNRAAGVLADSARRLEQAGAGALVIAANSMHRVYDDVAAAIAIPVLHIADCVGAAMKAQGVTSAALMGTRNVMTESWYRERLIAQDVDLLPPQMDDVEELERIIYDELMRGRITRDAERALRTMIYQRGQEGAEAIVLACTELELVVDTDANLLPIYDSAQIHARAAADWVLGSD